jgi:voltage-gated potassium channel
MFHHFKLFITEIRLLLSSPFFILLSILGNGLILISCYLFWLIEHEINPNLSSYMDALWWGFATATTTGYGDITPVSHAGKFLGIFLMLVGLALFSMYTALFAEIIISSKKNHHKDKYKKDTFHT